MNRRFMNLLALIAGAGCFPFDGGSHRLDDQYYLGATDIAEQMALYRQVSQHGGIQRIGPTVFAAGADARHVIAQRHPKGDRTKTEYFILERIKDTPVADPEVSVRGPFTSDEFEHARSRLGVAPSLSFSVILKDLR